MKKRIIAGLMAGALLVGGTAFADVDISGMSYDELVALKGQVDIAIKAMDMSEKNPLLYEDDVVSIRYSGITLDEYSDSAYLNISFLFENKTPDELHLVCKTVIINGCAVYLSKFVDLPSDCIYIHEWTTDADTFLKYGIELDDIETMAIVFEVNNGDHVQSDMIIVNN